jgi:hypothetical protein
MSQIIEKEAFCPLKDIAARPLQKYYVHPCESQV